MAFGAFRLNTLAAAMLVTDSITASGGAISYYLSSSTLYKVHRFTTAGSNSFIVSATTGNPTIDLLVVGGGGGSGGLSISTNFGSGGGGGGQVQYITNLSVSPQTYSLTVGSGGTAGTTAGSAGGTGGSSIALGYTSVGGGGGAGYVGNAPAAGAAGGGGDAYNASGRVGIKGTGTFGGGNGLSQSTGAVAMGGGGGSNAAVGGNASGTTSGAGADGPTNSITGTLTYYGSGGGGGNTNGTTGTNGLGTYGLGAQGRGYAGAAAAGNAGSSGIVVLRYPIIRASTVSYISTASTQTTSLTFPTVSAGDIAVIFNTATGNTTTVPTAVTPTGFTSISNTSQSTTLGQRTIVSYKICTGSESGTTLTTMTGTGTTFSTILIYRADITPNSLVISTVNAETTAAAPASQTLTMSGVTGPMIGFAYYTSSATVTTRTSSVTPTQEITYLSRQYIKTYESTSSAVTFSNSTISMTDYGINSLVSFTIQVL